ncbi:MAG: S4 domain-containing protein [Candidatus Diapherotrites archaeon]|nr:S4 domain-containing protein [Candidatus Diapherotrites archaeon]MDZ4256391.1 S4 domain-containing protein [archaeon]
MAKKGNPTKQKRLAVAPIRHLQRKRHVWAIRQNSGGYTRETSVPLGFVVRDLLKIARTLREARQIISAGNIHVDTIPRKEYRYPVGLFDIISIPTVKKQYTLLLDGKGRLMTRETPADRAGQKPVKIVRKTRVKGNKILVQTQDGYVYSPNNDVLMKVDDSVIVQMKDGHVMGEHLPLQKGSRVFIIGGTHVGEVAKVEEIVPGTMKRKKLVNLAEGKEKFQTTIRNIMVIDETTAGWIQETNPLIPISSEEEAP